MLGAITKDSVVCLESATLKKAPPFAPAASSLASQPTCCTWAPDNSALFVASGQSIDRYDTAGFFDKPLHVCNTGPVTSIVSKDKGSTIFFSNGAKVHCLELQSSKIVQTFDSHRGRISHLALSVDESLLASVSDNAVHVHSLGAHTSYTVLRGLPSGGTFSACEFHPHSRTRLLIGSGTQFLVCDTTRPSGPIKTVTMGKEKGCAGDIVAITSSPFSKSLVAVASGGGTVGLIDLDKERSLFRVLQLQVPLTALVFSPEGVSLYAGTKTGKVLIQELRSLDKPPKTITVSSKGDRVIAMSIQRKIKAGETPASQTTSNSPLAQQDINKASTQRVAEGSYATSEEKRLASTQPQKPSPNTARPAVIVKAPDISRDTRRAPRTETSSATIAPSPLRKISNATSPGRKVSAGSSKRTSSPPLSASVEQPAPRNIEEVDISVRVDDLLATPKGAHVNDNAGSADPLTSLAPLNAKEPRVRTRAASSSRSVVPSAPAPSRASSRTHKTSTASSSARSATVVERTKTFTGSTSSVPPMPENPTALRASAKPSRERILSRTPSPDLPAIEVSEPTTPIRSAKANGKSKATSMGVLGLGTPAVEEDAKLELAMQIPPRQTPNFDATMSNNPAPMLSPMRNSHAQRPGIPASPRAKDMLQALLRDALYDFRQETRSEILGLHLDLVRMGRGWRKEMREAMEEFGGELRALREENARLREENERLRRGY